MGQEGGLVINVLTSNPQIYPANLGVSIFQKAMQDGIFKICTTNLKNFAPHNNNRIDDYPFGGGSGVLIRADVIENALNSTSLNTNPLIIIPSAKGAVFNNKMAKQFAETFMQQGQICFVAGRFEGIDQRFIEKYNAKEVSLGGFVLAGGDVAVLTICEAILRFVPNIVGNQNTHDEESFNLNFTEEEIRSATKNIHNSSNLQEATLLQNFAKTLQTNAQNENKNVDIIVNYFIQNPSQIVEYNHYTRPSTWQNLAPPAVLLSGNHAQIRQWRVKNAIVNTLTKLLINNH